MKVDKNFIEKIEQLAVDASGKNNESLIIEVDGRKYWTDSKKMIKTTDECHPETIHTSTLTSIVNFINNPLEKYDIDSLMIHIMAPNKVALIEKASGYENNRNSLIIAKPNHVPFIFGRYNDQQEFMISMFTQFIPNQESEMVASIAGDLSIVDEDTSKDNGTSNSRKVKSGIISNSGLEIPKLVKLKPYRTFNEIDQPEGIFLFRYTKAQGGVVCSLTNADGGTWENVAMTSIYKYFEKNVPGIRIIA